jgi:ferredoxin
MPEPTRLTSTLLDSLAPLVAALRSEGYTVIAPTLRDGAIVLAEIDSAEDLPYGWGVELAAGSYRVRRRQDNAAFGHSSGPQSWKTYLHPPRVALWTALRDNGQGFTVREPEPEDIRHAFLGVRPCDLRAIAIQDRVLGKPGTAYARRRETAFVVAVNCTEPGEACFCVTAGGGPAAGPGADITLTELAGGYLARTETPKGARLLEKLPQRPAADAETDGGVAAVAAATERMGRQLPPVDLQKLLSGTRQSARWDEIAQRCLACGNCTMVCPTCFCTTVEDTSDLSGNIAQRWQSWDSCFDLDFSYLHGGPVRSTTQSRYRQWLSHKLGTWHDQFGESGCVGCGRCIVWCPVGIDLTAETTALAKEVDKS